MCKCLEIITCPCERDRGCASQILPYGLVSTPAEIGYLGHWSPRLTTTFCETTRRNAMPSFRNCWVLGWTPSPHVAALHQTARDQERLFDGRSWNIMAALTLMRCVGGQLDQGFPMGPSDPDRLDPDDFYSF